MSVNYVSPDGSYMTGCFVVVHGRQCSKDARETFGGMPVCWQHQRMMMNVVVQELWWPAGREHSERITRESNTLRRDIEAAFADIDNEERLTKKAAREKRRRETSVVYFVERDTFIKIGHTSDLRKRMYALSRGGQMAEGMTVGPVNLLATLPGDCTNESWLHGKFAEHRIPGTEWFYPDPTLTDFISGLKSSVAA